MKHIWIECIAVLLGSIYSTFQKALIEGEMCWMQMWKVECEMGSEGHGHCCFAVCSTSLVQFIHIIRTCSTGAASDGASQESRPLVFIVLMTSLLNWRSLFTSWFVCFQTYFRMSNWTPDITHGHNHLVRYKRLVCMLTSISQIKWEVYSLDTFITALVNLHLVFTGLHVPLFGTNIAKISRNEWAWLLSSSL